jgi:probable HAF family extracellular repeat protein
MKMKAIHQIRMSALPLFVLIFCLITVPVLGQSFEGLGFLNCGKSYSAARAVSADGSVVAGIVQNEQENFEAFLWTAATGMVGLGTLPGYSRSEATDISADGSVVVGISGNSSFDGEAFLWSAETGMISLGVLSGMNYSRATGVSGDGSVVVGYCERQDGQTEAFFWTADSGIVRLGFLPGMIKSRATDVSADGSVVVGYSELRSGYFNGVYEAFRWTAETGMVGMRALNNGDPRSKAFAVSADGLIIAGTTDHDDEKINVKPAPFRWTAETGMIALWNLYGSSKLPAEVVYDVSNNGSIVLSRNQFGNLGTLVWNENREKGWYSLEEEFKGLGLNITGWQPDYSVAVSDDGKVLVGSGTNPQGHREAWRAVLSPSQPNDSIDTGTTVIVHGLNLGNNLFEDAKWTLSMAEAIAKRLGGGQIYTVTDGLIPPQPYKSYGTGGHKIIVFDWIEESDLSVFRLSGVFGFSEGAGDALAATLISGALKGLWTLEQLHFIGHSRGAIVSSEAIQRLGLYAKTPGMLPPGLNVDKDIHFTTLDAHAWDHRVGDYIGEPFSARDHEVNGMFIVETNGKFHPFGVVCWENVKYADNYFHISDGISGLKDLNGLPFIPGIKPLANRNLSDREGINHTAVHSWYHGTIDRCATDDGDGVIIDHDRWYIGNERKERGFNYNLASIETIDPILIDSDPTLKSWHIFNGDFSKFKMIEKIPSVDDMFISYMPGWEYQGGEGNGVLGKYDENGFNPHLVLYKAFNIDTRTHNYFYIPNNVELIWFRYRVVQGSKGDRLKVYIRNQLIAEFSLDHPTYYRWAFVRIPAELRGKTSRLTFKLENGGASNIVKSEIWIDDVNFQPNKYINASLGSPANSGINYTLAREAVSVSLKALLHAYDSFGNHTGPTSDTTWVAEIPGSQYITEADTMLNPRQAIILPEPPPGVEYTFQIESRDASGSVYFQVEDATGVVKTVSALFENIQLHHNSTAKTTLQKVTPELNLQADLNGDGQFETTLQPSQYFEDFEIAAVAGPNGSISPSDTTVVNYGGSLRFTITPNGGFQIADVKVNGESIGAVNEYTFANIKKDHTISAEFRQTNAPALPALSINDATVNENAGRILFTISLSKASTVPIEVDIKTIDGLAKGGLDYRSFHGGTVFFPGIVKRTFALSIYNDIAFENIETFTVELLNPVNSVLADAQGLGTIIDDDELAIISDSFTNRTPDRDVGDPLHGTPTEFGNRTWDANPWVVFGNNVITNIGTSDSHIGGVPFKPIVHPDSAIAKVEAKVKVAGSEWVGLGFASAAQGGYWGIGQVWFLLKKNGLTEIWANGTQHYLGGPQAPVFYPTGFNKMKVEYDAQANTFSAWVNDVKLLDRYDLDLKGFKPKITHAGFHMYNGSLHTQDQMVIDDFKVGACSADTKASALGKNNSESEELEASAENELAAIPDKYSLEQNYPNPFNPATTIRYGLPKEGHVTLKIYNLTGQEVRTLVDDVQSAGLRSLTWDGNDNLGQSIPSGLYIYRLVAGDFAQTRKMSLVK